jgi:peroxiredoxin
MTITSNQQAPDFSLEGVDGSVHTLASYEDADALVIVQWCNHCPYVIGWEERLNDVQRDYADRGVRIVAVNSNDVERQPADSFELMVERAQERGFTFDYLYDREQDVARALGSERTPEVFVFDRDRRLVYHGAIDDNRDETAVSQRYLREALDAVLAGDAPNVSETPPVGCSVKWLPDAES